jgi:hypothetical protein
LRSVLALLFLVWFVIGALAGLKRHYFSWSDTIGAEVVTVVVMTLAGPLNYCAVNPKIAHC